MLIRRGESGGTDVKTIKNEPGSRRVTWIHRDAVGEEIGREDDPTDTYDPRTRSWYTRARGTHELFWTDVYIFFTQRVPGITASATYRDAHGRLYLFRPLEMSTRQVRAAQIRSSQIGATKINPRKIEPAQIKPPQTGARQFGRLFLFAPPCVPCCGAALQNGDMLIVWHLPSL